jgi:hypothetical protein
MTLTAPLDKLTDSTQAQDIATSRGPNDVWRDCYRVKAYVKWEDVALFTHPSQWAFPQPFQVAAARTGQPWDVCNRVFLGQLAGCNLNCDFCYRGQVKATVEVTPEEYVEAFFDYNDAFPEQKSGVLRISGGEPMLYQEWALGVLRYWGDTHDGDTAMWLDTNLTVAPMAGLRRAIAWVNCGVCGCFKPGLWDLGDQLEIAKHIADAGCDLYLYWPCSDTLSDAEFVSFLDRLDAAIPRAPLRLTVLNIKYNYAAVQEKNPDDWQEKHGRAQANFGVRRAQWAEWCANHYPVWMCNTPSHEVEIGGV